MKFASEEIRTKAVHAYLDGKATARQLADILGYTPATICNWVRAYRENQRIISQTQWPSPTLFLMRGDSGIASPS